MKISTTTPTSITPPISNASNDEIIKALNQTIDHLKEILNQTNSLQNKVDGLEEMLNKTNNLQNKVDGLEDILTETSGTKLILIGLPKSQQQQATVQQVRSFLTNQLNLPDIAETINVATQSRAGIIFDTENALNKHRIMTTATKMLQNSGTQILNYIVGSPNDSANAQPNIDIRNNFYATDEEDKANNP